MINLSSEQRELEEQYITVVQDLLASGMSAAQVKEIIKQDNEMMNPPWLT